MSTTVETQRIAENRMRITIDIDLQGNLLQFEEHLQTALNQAGTATMRVAIERHDADGSPIKVGAMRFTSKGRFSQTYETLYGSVDVQRHVYQSQHGGRTFCPLEEDARMLLNATPKYAKVVAAKYSYLAAPKLRCDLLESNARSISISYAKTIADFVGAAVAAKESHWEYEIPELPKEVATVSVGLDGTCMLMKDGNWRQAMCGSISLYDKSGERMYTVYAGAAPEYGKETFHERFDRELERVKELFPDALYVGLADGAPDNWSWLKPRTERQMIDFWHAREYVGLAARAMSVKTEKDRETWEAEWSSRLKHERGAVPRLLREISQAKKGAKAKDLEDLTTAERYFKNNKEMMGYWRHISEGLPIGSGVTEAACKVLIKERLCKSGMRWKEEGAACVIALRALRMSDGRWEQFWSNVMRYGL